MKNSGFTLIELLVVIAIIGILSGIVFASLNTARNNAYLVKAKAELAEISIAVAALSLDTGLIPSVGTPKISAEECVCNNTCDGSANELYVDTNEAGVDSTDGNYPNWKGPYMKTIPLDPWGSSYIFDSDYTCGTQVGCEGHNGDIVSVVHSAGPNKSPINSYDSDDIVRIFCTE